MPTLVQQYTITVECLTDYTEQLAREMIDKAISDLEIRLAIRSMPSIECSDAQDTKG
jgi:hypothetical protein